LRVSREWISSVTRCRPADGARHGLTDGWPRAVRRDRHPPEREARKATHAPQARGRAGLGQQPAELLLQARRDRVVLVVSIAAQDEPIDVDDDPAHSGCSSAYFASALATA
jgi:hypothetical protein